VRRMGGYTNSTGKLIMPHEKIQYQEKKVLLKIPHRMGDTTAKYSAVKGFKQRKYDIVSTFRLKSV
jgi:hypothetical protein